MNMNGKLPEIPPLVMANPVVELLINMLNEVKAGHVSSVAVIGVTTGGAVAIATAGGQRGDMYVGAGMLQQTILKEISQPQQRPSILRATVSPG